MRSENYSNGREVSGGGSGMSRNLAYLLIGGGIGAGLALLFAPKAGAELRSDIADTARQGYDGAVDLAGRVKEQSVGLYNNVLSKRDNLLNLAGDAMTETKDRVTEAVAAGKDKAEEVRSAADKLSEKAETGLTDAQNRIGNQGRKASNVI